MDPHDLPLFVHQLAGLLRAGRTPAQLWRDVLDVHRGSTVGFSRAVQPVLQSAQQAAAMGMSVPEVLRQGAGRLPDRHVLARFWPDLAACVEVAERSGAPLADVLDRYAVQLEAELDADAARATALAGPKATVKLLSWLPVFGIGLGFLIGVQPFAVLLGSPLGTAALISGLALMVAGRFWSHRLVSAAARTIEP
ncbi:type II secretion system F family protein [Arthrobacter sp. H5]|uniref:type II secretion system F family protein n=1 Tax=Arthrobacter sp. H5 TaxID=1267973 RepID=UPI0020A6BEB0|nr:type II secretion system F family protein [Arthrobacter sp. H5]